MKAVSAGLGVAAAAAAACIALAPAFQADAAKSGGPGPVQLSVSDCRLDDVLRLLGACLECRLDLRTNLDQRVTCTVADADVETTLMRILKPVNYMITWKRVPDAQGRPVDRIDAITVYGGEPPAAGLARQQAPSRAASMRASARLDDYLGQENETVSLAVRHAIGRAADPDMLNLIQDRFAKSQSEEEKDKIRDLVGTITSRQAEDGLIAMAGATPGEKGDGLQASALKALANLGTATATDHLLDRLGKADKREAEQLGEIVQGVVATPAAVSCLRVAAEGNKRFSTDAVRVAAVRGLGRFQDRRTRDLLKKLQEDPSEPVRVAAADALDDAEDDEP